MMRRRMKKRSRGVSVDNRTTLVFPPLGGRLSVAMVREAWLKMRIP
jgi:hypothetical protein